MNIEARLGLSRVFTVLAITAALAGCDGSGSGSSPNGATASIAASSSPTVSGSPVVSIAANADYSFRPHSTSPAGTSLLFSIQNKPAWATFGTLTGLLSGIPATSDAGNYSNIIIAATDGTNSVALPGFSIRVTPPGTTVASASGANSGTTTGSTSSSSGTSSVASTSGSNSGTTTGSTSGSSTSSGAAPTSTADTVTLSWLAPTQNTDGSALTNLSGYDIHYGTSAGAMTQQIQINTVGMLTYVVSNLTAGTWYFEVTAVNSAGVDSGPSSTVSATI